MRSTEVSDLRWPQLTLTLIWRNVKGHIQSCIDTSLINYPHSSQSHHAKLRLLTISLKSCEGCSSYDVITSWPDLTRPNFFHQKLRKGCPISYGKFQHDPPNGVASSSEKLMGGGLHQPPPPDRARVKTNPVLSTAWSAWPRRCTSRWWFFSTQAPEASVCCSNMLKLND